MSSLEALCLCISTNQRRTCMKQHHMLTSYLCGNKVGHVQNSDVIYSSTLLNTVSNHTCLIGDFMLLSL